MTRISGPLAGRGRAQAAARQSPAVPTVTESRPGTSRGLRLGNLKLEVRPAGCRGEPAAGLARESGPTHWQARRESESESDPAQSESVTESDYKVTVTAAGSRGRVRRIERVQASRPMGHHRITRRLRPGLGLRLRLRLPAESPAAHNGPARRPAAQPGPPNPPPESPGGQASHRTDSKSQKLEQLEQSPQDAS